MNIDMNAIVSLARRCESTLGRWGATVDLVSMLEPQWLVQVQLPEAN
jgi:hypothetical protein